ncbi:intersectin-2-like isoform X2 [Symsagittifera roscoffensis]|uniref:intersectin-2-like isoform X2 n=1 Tax=Symsagittifera roscoffensis TaxID=84072 RepID=UPI00307BC677
MDGTSNTVNGAANGEGLGVNNKQDLLTAIERAEVISSHLNEKLQLDDHESQLKWLQEHVLWGPNTEDITLTSNTNELGPRKLFYYGHLVKSKSGKHLFVFLFNDFLLLTESMCAWHDAQKKLFDARCHEPYLTQYRQPMLITDVQAFNSSSGVLGLDNHISFEYRLKKYTLKADGAAKRKSWMSALKHAISDYVEMVGKRERIVGCPDGRGLIKIEVLHAENVAILSDNKDASLLSPYVKITLGDQTLKTPGAKEGEGGEKPSWHYPGQLVFCDLEKETMWIALYIKRKFAPDEYVCAKEFPLTCLPASGGKVSKEQDFDLGDGQGTVKLKVLVSKFQS